MRNTRRLRHRLVASFIKSIQIGTLAGTTTATISSIDVANSFVILLGMTYGGGGSSVLGLNRITLTNATTVTSVASDADSTIRFAVIECYPGLLKRVQYFTITATGSTDTLTIDAVDDKAFVIFLGNTTNDGTQTAQWSDLRLTNSTTITTTRALASNTNIVSGVLLSFN